MFSSALKKIFGSRNDRLLKKYQSTVNQINKLESVIKALSDEALVAKTGEFKQRINNGATLDEILPEAFAVVREASVRALNMRPFDVQLVGGMALHYGKIAEMRTGEGKTLVATLPVYLNALTGKGVHVVTVNDYLASRDAAWMGKLYNFLGMSVGTILSGKRENKKEAYLCDITYATNNELGFDYLRDNMVYDAQERVIRELNFAIIDEVDSILIDEARTPLIISGQASESHEHYVSVNRIIPHLTQAAEPDPLRPNAPAPKGDFILNEKERSVTLTEQGHESVEKLLVREGILPAGNSLYEASHQILLHRVLSALRAHHLFLRDQHYVVQNNEVVIVDDFTGRLMPGRRWSDGLHQAIEAKENCEIQSENQTMASITFQNFFRLYKKLSGMTGTADTEAYEFQQIYNLETMVIPTHRKMVRKDHADRIFANTPAKYKAIVAEVKECNSRGQPVLVGTTSIENSEMLSELFNKDKLSHQVLNAKQHEKEAKIVIDAGRPKAITIATNMAGRGTDIVLGGNIEKLLDEIRTNPDLPETKKEQLIEEEKSQWKERNSLVINAGGLRIIGSERHESRRIDNQLRGRSGRQGDPGESRFYLSLEDSLMRIFAGDRLKWIMTRLNVPEDEPIEHNMVSRSLETAQRRVEQHNFDIRKQLLEYDDVANEQRKIFYAQRAEIIEDEENKNIRGIVENMISGKVEDYVTKYIPAESMPEQWNLTGLSQSFADGWRVSVPASQWYADNPNIHDQEIFSKTEAVAMGIFREKFSMVSDEVLLPFMRRMALSIMDHHWRIHLTSLDNLRGSINLRAQAQKDPKQEFKKEAFLMFEQMLTTVQEEIARTFMLLEVTQKEAEEVPPPEVENIQYQHVSAEDINNQENDFKNTEENNDKHKGNTVRRDYPKVGRNDQCPCKSGKKYKNCHGKI